MARRVMLPSADELFRSTEDGSERPVPAGSSAEPGVEARRGPVLVVPDRTPATPSEPERAPSASGRIRHDEKVTVYVTSDELLAIEQARLTLRRDHGLAVDRGRLVREAIQMALDGLDGLDGALVRRLADQE